MAVTALQFSLVRTISFAIRGPESFICLYVTSRASIHAPPPIPLSTLQLKKLGSNLVENQSGILTTPDHRDVKFDYGDSIDWAAVEETSFWYHHRNQCFTALMARFKPCGPLFEIGSGNGNVALALQAAGIPTVAIEPTVRSALTSRDRGVHHVICARVEEAGFPAGSLANVGMFDVLEHIDDDFGQLKTLRSLMPVGGRFYCAVPAHRQLWSADDEAAGHCRRYSLPQLNSLFERAGFQVEYASYFFRPLLLPIFFFRTLPGLLRLRTQHSPELSRTDHALPKNLLGALLQRLLAREVRMIAAGKCRHLGASCLLVAQAC